MGLGQGRPRKARAVTSHRALPLPEALSRPALQPRSRPGGLAAGLPLLRGLCHARLRTEQERGGGGTSPDFSSSKTRAGFRPRVAQLPASRSPFLLHEGQESWQGDP